MFLITTDVTIPQVVRFGVQLTFFGTQTALRCLEQIMLKFFQGVSCLYFSCECSPHPVKNVWLIPSFLYVWVMICDKLTEMVWPVRSHRK